MSVSTASVNHPSSTQTTQSYSRDSPAPVDPQFLLQLPSHQSHSPARSATHPGPASPISSRTTHRSKAAAERLLFTSPRPSSRAQSQDRSGVIRTIQSWPWTLNGLNSNLRWPGIHTHRFRESPCPSPGSLVFWAAVNAPLRLLPPVLLALSFMCSCPQRLRLRRRTVSLWMRAPWMSWTVR